MPHGNADVTLHINESLSGEERHRLREEILGRPGVMSADGSDARPHLMVVKYDPASVNSHDFVIIAEKRGLHAQLIGF